MQDSVEPDSSTTSGATAQTLAALLETAGSADFSARATIIEHGGSATAAYVLIAGSAEVLSVDGTVLGTLEPGALFGTDALVSQRSGATTESATTRNATVRTLEPSSVLVIQRRDFMAAVDEDKALASELRSDLIQHSALSQIVRSPLHELLAENTNDRADLGALSTSFEPGAALMTEGEDADGLYILTAGVAGVFKTIAGHEVRLGDALPGSVVGELAVLDDAPRAATVRAVEPVKAIFVPRDRLLADDASNARAWFSTLRRMYEVPDRGLVTQHLVEFEDSPALRTTYELSADHHVVCHVTDGRYHLEVLRNGEPVERAQTWTWSGSDGAIELSADSRHIPVLADVRGEFEDLQLLFRCVVAALPLPESAGDTLASQGRLELGRRHLSRLDDDEICTCIGVTEVQIKRVVRTYAPDLEQLQEMLGCGTVCGSCMDEVEDLVVIGPPAVTGASE